jgi:hypothetical protein
MNVTQTSLLSQSWDSMKFINIWYTSNIYQRNSNNGNGWTFNGTLTVPCSKVPHSETTLMTVYTHVTKSEVKITCSCNSPPPVGLHSMHRDNLFCDFCCHHHHHHHHHDQTLQKYLQDSNTIPKHYMHLPRVQHMWETQHSATLRRIELQFYSKMHIIKGLEISLC